jgi:hypothetical protein
MYAGLAQLVEQLICNQWVGSSNLSTGTTHQGFQRIPHFTKLSGLHGSSTNFEN